MNAQGMQQHPQAADQAHVGPNNEKNAGSEAPVPNENRFPEIETISTQNTNDTFAYCEALWNQYQATGDASWLEKRRLTLQRYRFESEYLGVHLMQGKDAAVAALEHPGSYMANVGSSNIADDVPAIADEQVMADNLNPPANLEDNMPVKPEQVTPATTNHCGASLAHNPNETALSSEILNLNAPQAIDEHHMERLFRCTPPKVEHTSPEPQTISIHDKISHSWPNNSVLRFNLEHVGPPGYVSPALYFSWWNRSINQWQWRRNWGGVDVKRHFVLATSHNLAICRKAFTYLVDHKDTLVRQLADAKKLPLRHHRQDV
ncbi:uncharacterized protein F4807DRAFT_467897 [Annulohypoxylon truncatum]|uniref:uncharacterized protein n=1 Tax=Annulohypoxylon truncatum TaxID=327061 RepID=UPI0020079023|nr:uncharacterized protein F4807DRAFT_467897 [Annulohypoxylon truncatum]KAI1208924.1 hypothetical protein F4807DRAFT_467897 [Annulohypoxylon truncatum]